MRTALKLAPIPVILTAVLFAAATGAWGKDSPLKKASPTPADAQAAMASPSDVAGCEELPECPCKPCIRYRQHCLLNSHCCRSCAPPIATVLEVPDPCCGCYVRVPVCLPACCAGEPTVCSRGGLLVRGVVTYQWCCGYTVKVVFLRCGDVTVHYFGD